MGYEASKTKTIIDEYNTSLFNGKGIDIGCGPDPVCKNARPFDINDGDANEITKYVNEKFDFVFSSHCLEHMKNPSEAIQEWWSLVKPDGHLIFTVPDEDLYEQGYFPSLFNDDHKFTFTISKYKSWNDKSYNLLNLVSELQNGKLLKIELQDQGFNKKYYHHGVYSLNTAKKLMNIVRKISTLFKKNRFYVYRSLANLLRLPIDQTHIGPDNKKVLAQILVIVKKTS